MEDRKKLRGQRDMGTTSFNKKKSQPSQVNHSDYGAVVVSGSSGLRQNCSTRDTCLSVPYTALYTPASPEFSVFHGVFSLLTDIP